MPISRRRLAAVLLPMLSIALLGMGPRQGLSPEPPKVVATFSVLGDLVKQVGGDRVQLTVLVGPNGDAHTYEPVPKDAAVLRDAALVFENGIGFDPWIEGLVASSGSKAKRVRVTEGIEIRKPAPDVLAGSGNERPTCAHGHTACRGDQDPHVWHDVANAITMVENITAALVDADPSYAANYRLNRDAYLKTLRELDGWVAGEVRLIPEKRRVIVTGHDTFGYFAARHGFRTTSILGSVSTEAADPSAAEFAQVIRDVKSLGVGAVFAENIANPRMAEQVAREAGVKVRTLYTDALGAPDSAVRSYVELVRHNVKTMAEALK
jgi:zinc/manganese transport system substrate-binding protein